MFENDKRIVITLDAGGTNCVFSAMRAGKYIIEPISKKSNAHDLDLCLATMVEGFSEVIAKLDEKPVAISFAFPGPADYEHGIIGGYLPNFPSFRDGVALGPFLEDKFGIPVFINTDGDLFAYGEALGGILPEVNSRLEAMGSEKRYKNLLGYTWGTGFGIGSVIDGRLNRGNNSCVETFCLDHKLLPGIIAEEGVAARAVTRVYGELTGNMAHGLDPKGVFDVAEGTIAGDQKAAIEAFRIFGQVSGHAMATATTLTDSLVVIGGGLTGSRKYIMPSLLEEMRSTLRTLSGETVNRVQMEVFDLDNEEEFARFARGEARPLRVYGSDRTVTYDPMKRTGVAISHLGASQAIAIGAYSFALSSI